VARPAEPDFTMGEAIRWVLLAAMMFWPRLFIVGFEIFDNQFAKAYDSWLIPFVGFFVLPWTTVGYALMWGTGSYEVHGVIEWLVIAFCFLLDLITWGGVRRR
jgi:hypothetical protein